MRFYKILQAKQCGNAEGLTAYERQFVEYLKKIDIKTITGVLPLTFTAKGGTAADWVIEGNDDVGENLWDENYKNITTSMTYKSIYVGNGLFTLSTNTPMGVGGTSLFLMPGQQSSGATTAKYGAYDGSPRTVTAVDGYVTLVYRIYDNKDPRDYQTMLVKGSTAPDHYIPYQQGVGERTKNKMPVPVNGVYSANRTTVTVTDGVYHIVQTEGSGGSDVDIDIPEFEVLDAGYLLLLNDALVANAAIAFKYNGTQITYYTFSSIDRVEVIDNTALAGKKVNQIRINATGSGVMDFTISPMIADSNTYTTYISYGYQIPLTVSQQGEQPDKTYDIYIGDSPLTEGQQVSKTSTGQDIELFKGENVVSTTLYNKPSAEIKYK